MDLTRDDYQKVILLVIGALLGAIFAVLGNLFIWNWNKPDVRFGTGDAYIHPKLAIATVGLKNWGGSDAENVTITASFADPFNNFSTDQVATSFEPSAGGVDKKSVTGTIKRLAPGEIVNIYFTTNLLRPGSTRSRLSGASSSMAVWGKRGHRGFPGFSLICWSLPW
jgi:hypothetical protein